MKRLENWMMVSRLEDAHGLVVPLAVGDDGIDDESASDELAPLLGYGVDFFGADLSIREFVRRLNDGEISIPDFGNGAFWPIETASSFVESIILGLPVPEILMAAYQGENGKYYVIDGQRRLRTLQGFYSGKFPTTGDEFKLMGVDSRIGGRAYLDLRYDHRSHLDETLIHATVVSQKSPLDGYVSAYQIFKRLNGGSGQTSLHEFRSAVYEGALIDLIGKLNENRDWRMILGKPSPRLKDQELILRFMAMLYQGHEYIRPMSEFLNVFVQENRNPVLYWILDTAKLFDTTVKTFADAKGKGAFRFGEGRMINAAVFDSMSVGLASAIMEGNKPNSAAVRKIHDRLISDDEYLQAVTQGTSKENSVAKRLKIAKAAFTNA